MGTKEVEVTIDRAVLSKAAAAHAVVTLGKQGAESKATEKSATPAWDQTFNFAVSDENTEALQITLYGKSMLFGHKELGWCEVLLYDLPKDVAAPLTLKLIVGSGVSEQTLDITCKAIGFGVPGSSMRSLGAALNSTPLAPMLQDLVPYLEKAAPLFAALDALLDVLAPVLLQLWAWIQVAWYQYNLEALLPAILGLAMVLLGGTYMTTIAAVEAYRMCGWEQTKHCLKLLYGELRQAHIIVSQQDEPDEAQPAPKTANVHMLERVLKAMDPMVLEEGLAGLYRGTFAVVATLRTRFAHAITLGNSLGEMGNKQMGPLLIPVVKKVLPEEHEKWAPLVVKYTISTVACSLSWMLLRLFTAFHSAMYGAHLMASGVVTYLVKQKRITPQRAAAFNYTVLTWAVGVLGFLWQLSTGFRLPFPLNLLLFPLTIVEWCLMLLVNWDKSWI